MPKPSLRLRVQLDEPAKDGLDSFADRRGMTQLTVLSRLVEWFVKQPESTQQVILGGDEAEAVRLQGDLLQRIAERGRPTR